MPPDDTRPVAPSADTFPADREFVISRLFHASADVLFFAWTEAARIAQWWGPEGFTIPVARIDLRPGGAWRLVMRSPQGVDYPLKGVYQEIAPAARLVTSVDLHEHPGEWHRLLQEYRRESEGKVAPPMAMVVTFEARGNDTALTVRLRFDSRTERHAMLKTGMAEGWAQSLDRLERYLSRSGKGAD